MFASSVSRVLVFAYRRARVAAEFSDAEPAKVRRLSRCSCSIFGRKSDENRAKCDCIACCIRLWRVGVATGGMISAPSQSVGSVTRRAIASNRLSPRGVAHINNPCKCFPASAHPAFEPGGRNPSSPRPGEHRGSAGFSLTAPGDPNSEAVLPRRRAVLGRAFHSRRSLGPGPRTRGSRRQGTGRLTLI
jgi:hypothetical protein